MTVVLITGEKTNRHAASRAEALHMGIAVSGKLLDSGVQRVHNRRI
jgi:hypothetical protein